MTRRGYTEPVPERDQTPQVPLSLIRCMAALVVIGVFLPGALEGLANMAVALAELPYPSLTHTVNGWPDVLRQAILQGADWRGVADWMGQYGLRLALVAAGVMLLRGRGPLVGLVRRSA